MRRIFVALMIALFSGLALADDFVGQASVIDGDTLEIHGTRIRLWGIDAPEAVSSAVAKTVCNIVAVQRPRTTLMLLLLAALSIVCRSASTNMAARSRTVRSEVTTSASGWCGAALRWIGLNTRKADMARTSRTPSVRGEESGRAVMSSRGSIAPASARTESRPTARMMQTRIPDL